MRRPGPGVQFLNSEEPGGERKGTSVSLRKGIYENFQTRRPRDAEGSSLLKDGWIPGRKEKVHQVCRVIRMKMGHEYPFDAGMVETGPLHLTKSSRAHVQEYGRASLKNGNGRGTPIV
jgi:hypothetical protein